MVLISCDSGYLGLSSGPLHFGHARGEVSITSVAIGPIREDIYVPVYVLSGIFIVLEVDLIGTSSY